MGLRETLKARQKWLEDEIVQDKKNILRNENYIEQSKEHISSNESEIKEIRDMLNQTLDSSQFSLLSNT